MVKNKKQIKIIHESAVNYTFSNTGFTNIKKEENADTANKTTPNTEKGIPRSRSIDLRVESLLPHTSIRSDYDPPINS